MAPRCQLYLSAPASFPGETGLIEAALATSASPSLLLVGEGDAKRVGAIIAAAHRQNAIVLTDNRQMLTALRGFDGLHLGGDDTAPKAAREAVGADGVLGADCPLSRHRAMELAEAGADYVAFGRAGESVDDLADMVSWWSDIIEIPCAAWLRADAPEESWRKLAGCGADFIVPGPEIWDEAGAVRDRLARIAGWCGIEGA